MNANEPLNLLDTLEVIDTPYDLDLFADELEEHFNHAAGVSTLGCLSCIVGCVCTFSCSCTIWVADVPVDGQIVS